MFTDRTDAGRKLAASLERFRPRSPVIVALPRGGVPVAYQVAHALGAPLDVLVARKLGAPGHREFGIGAIAEGGAVYLDARHVYELGVSREYLDEVIQQESLELQRRVRAYRGDRPAIDVADRTVILVDDGLATGATARAAARSLRRHAPREVVLAVPVGPPSATLDLRAEVDEVVCLLTPAHLQAVGRWYERFDQTTDEEVIGLLARASQERAAAGASLGASDTSAPRGRAT